MLDIEGRELLLKALNINLRRGKLDEELHKASNASIYKKGDPGNLGNYRPISLLQTMYKILAALIKERIDAGIDNYVHKTQYGFRKAKSTAQALISARRLMDISEAEGSNLALILLDWEKAFDKSIMTDY